MTAGKIVALFRPDVKGRPQVALTATEIITDQGLLGDRHGKPGSKRQVLLMDHALIEHMGLQPGDLDENVTVDGLLIDHLQPGQQLRIGSVVLEITMPCPVCDKLDTIRPGLRSALRDRRGMFTRVLSPGHVRIGDSIIIEATMPATQESARRQ